MRYHKIKTMLLGSLFGLILFIITASDLMAAMEKGKYLKFTYDDSVTKDEIRRLMEEAEKAFESIKELWQEDYPGMIPININQKYKRAWAHGRYMGAKIVMQRISIPSRYIKSGPGRGLSVTLHELAHFIAPTTNPFLGEGLAEYFARGLNSDALHRATATRRKELFPLSKLSQLTPEDREFYSFLSGKSPEDRRLAYNQAGSFVKFLVDKGGIERFKSFYKGVDRRGFRHFSFEAVSPACRKFYKMTLKELEEEWLQTLDKYPEARKTDKRIRASLPAKFVEHFRRGNNHLNRGKLDKAISEYGKALEIKSDHSLAHAKLASAYQKKGSLDLAIAEYEKAIEISPNAIVYNNLGLVYADKGLFPQAVSRLREALLLDPNDANIRTNLGNIYAGEGMLREAVVEYREAVKIDPKFDTARKNLAAAHHSLGTNYYNLGKYDEAISELGKALETDPSLAEVHNSLGILYEIKGMKDEAEKEFELYRRLAEQE